MSNNFLTIQNDLDENSKVNYTIIDFGGKNSITNYYSNLVGNNSLNVFSVVKYNKGCKYQTINKILNANLSNNKIISNK